MNIERKLAIAAFLYDLQPDSPVITANRDKATIDCIKSCYSVLVFELVNAKFRALNDIKAVAKEVGQPPRCAGILKAQRMYEDNKARLFLRDGYVRT